MPQIKLCVNFEPCASKGRGGCLEMPGEVALAKVALLQISSAVSVLAPSLDQFD